MIQEATLIEAILGFRSQIDFLWQFFVTVHIAIFALLFIYDEAVESLNFIARAFAFAGVALFEWINGKALANTYILLDATLDQYRALYGQAEPLSAGLLPALRRTKLCRPSDDSPDDAWHGPDRRNSGVAVARIRADAQEGPRGGRQLSCSDVGARPNSGPTLA